MAIIVGTITVQSTPRLLDRRSSTAPGSNSGTKVETPPVVGIAEDAAHRGGVEHRCLVQVHPVLAEADREPDVVQVQHLGALLEQHTLRESRRPARVHEHRQGRPLRARGRGRRPALRSDPRTAKSWGTSPSPISTTWRRGRSERTSAMLRAKWSANTESTKTTSVPESARMNCSSCPPRRRFSGLTMPAPRKPA